MKSFATLITLLLAASTASASPVPLPGSESAVEQLRAQGHSERAIATFLSARHPCPSYHPPETQQTERDVSGDISPSMMASVFQKRELSKQRKSMLIQFMERVLAGKATGKREEGVELGEVVRPRTYLSRRAR